jgi:hypothetical protein
MADLKPSSVPVSEPQVSEMESDTEKTQLAPPSHPEAKPSNGGPYFTIDDCTTLEAR